MKKLLFLFSALILCNYSQAQWTYNSATDDLTSNNDFVGIGSFGTTLSDYNFGFGSGTTTDWFYFNLQNDQKKHIFSIGYGSTDNFLRLNNRFGSELFKVSTWDTNGNSMYIHLPKAESRVVIGSWGSYLQSEGHKLVVKDGSIKVEGNIFSTENIGIGTMSFTDGTDTYKLSVNGKVRAHGVKVYTSWADYVFYSDYHLPTLYEVEDYISKNGHLKDIPSAEEVEDNGIELGEMNKLLLQKIEELTLYTIQLKKEIDELKTKVD